MVKLKATVIAVNNSKNESIYLRASQRKIGLMYVPIDLESRQNVGENVFRGQYWIPPETSMLLYGMICEGICPEKIIGDLGLDLRPPRAVAEMVESWVWQDYLEKEYERRILLAEKMGDVQIVEARLDAIDEQLQSRPNQLEMLYKLLNK